MKMNEMPETLNPRINLLETDDLGISSVDVSAYWDKRFPPIAGGSGLLDEASAELDEALGTSTLDAGDLEDIDLEPGGRFAEWFNNATDGLNNWLDNLGGNIAGQWNNLRQWLQRQAQQQQPGQAAEAPAQPRRGFHLPFPSFGRRRPQAPEQPAAALGVPEQAPANPGEGRQTLFTVFDRIVNSLKTKGQEVTASVGGNLRDRLSKVKVTKEKMKKVTADWGPEAVAAIIGATGGVLAAATLKNRELFMAAEGTAVFLSAISTLAYVVGDARGPEAIPAAEKDYQRPVRALQKLCSDKALRRGARVLAVGAGAFAIAGGSTKIAEIFTDLLGRAPDAAQQPTGPVNFGDAGPVRADDWAQQAHAAVQQVTQSVQPDAATAGASVPGSTEAWTHYAQTVAEETQQMADATQGAADIAAKHTAEAVKEAAVKAVTELASSPSVVGGKELFGGTVLGHELDFVKNLPGIDHVQPVANALKNLTASFGDDNWKHIGPETAVKLTNRDMATWVANQLDTVIGRDPSTFDPFHKLLWEIGVAGRHATSSELASIANNYVATVVVP